jgi:hypothetical protein
MLDNPLAAPTPLRTVFAGPLSAQYEKGELRYIRFGTREVLRRIYVAVRDQNWQTIPINVKESLFESTDSTFHIELDARHELNGVLFEWHGTLWGKADGTIRAEMNGEPKSSFLRNRIGFCVLHPMETCSGQPCVVEHMDGAKENSHFPKLVSPHQPFLDLRALSYEVAPGVQAEVRLSGDEFETEDQRNWTDYTFKTYSTRLSIPVPVLVKPGDRVEQSVELKVKADATQRHNVRPAPEPVEITLHSETTPFPNVGIVYAGRLSPLGTHTRVDVAFDDPAWTVRLQEAAARQLPLEIACFSNDPVKDLARLHEQLEKLNATVVRFLLFPSSGPLTYPSSIAKPLIYSAFSNAVIAAGSCTHFADLNRNRHIASDAQEVVWPVDPYAHANDYRTVIENLQGQIDPPRTARSFSGDRPLVISSVRVPDIVTRAGWVAVSLKHLAQHGVSSITFDTRGLAVTELSQFVGTEIVHSTSSHPLTADALVVTKGTTTAQRPKTRTAFIANFSDEPLNDLRIAGQVVSLAAFELKALAL